MAYERQCICCGKTYQYCPHCGSFSNRPKWMFNYDTESCNELFNIISAYNMKVVGKDEVLAVVKKYNITDFAKYKPSIKKVLAELCSAPAQVEKTVEQPTVEEPKPVEDKPHFEGKKKNKFYNKNKDIELKDGEISE